MGRRRGLPYAPGPAVTAEETGGRTFDRGDLGD